MKRTGHGYTAEIIRDEDDEYCITVTDSNGNTTYFYAYTYARALEIAQSYVAK